MGYGCKAYIIDLGGRGGWSGSKTKVVQKVVFRTLHRRGIRTVCGSDIEVEFTTTLKKTG